jgi:hypothetical protein
LLGRNWIWKKEEMILKVFRTKAQLPQQWH